MSKNYLGNSWPLGSTVTKRGVNFSVAAPEAQKIELLIFSNHKDKEPSQIIRLDKNNQSGDYWHVEVKGLSNGCCYCYRVLETRSISSGSPSNSIYLLDPCSRQIQGWEALRQLNTKQSLKSVVCEREQFNFEDHPRPRHAWNKTTIYELHVGGFTSQIDSGVNPLEKGTFLGLIDKIPYLKDLGVTTIELLPVFAFNPYEAPFGVSNYWGYSPLNWFTPHESYISKSSELSGRDQFRKFVSACHDEQLEVILDVVYNHTAEGNENGPTISWKGFGESVYYHKNKKKGFLDVSGCGNTIAANHPLTRHLILESLRCWAQELGVDGFRFDLGIALSRGESLKPLDNPPIFQEIESDPILSELKLISEPWDCGGLYRLADFPAKRISTWNGHFRDNVRKFWKGDKDCAWELKDHLQGSPNLYKDKENSNKKSINFITAHDGYTLNDLVSFSYKHNLANGENNRDGDNHNNNWNHGIEGPCSDISLTKLRKKQQRNLLSTLLLSQGVPMISMGDEVGRSQGGNNNAWCQNSPLGWMIWDTRSCDKDLSQYLKNLLSIRKSLPGFFSPELGLSDIQQDEETWIEWHGIELGKPDWGSWSHTISYSINIGKSGAAAWIGLNAYSQSMVFELPKPTSKWIKVLDTSEVSKQKLSNNPELNQKDISLENRSMVLMISNDYFQKIKM
ncbi:isoamylase [Prochlorococcus sp. MIT 1223]|uniref:glycogen debranching protein n=1 Tax=Prochlorococcus sp. MIT 1223 TaxID=3096217 RepID=UPI002A75F94E|nr:isoamylase [Prochlorococcus sp. MIT 1223]